jgi:hypothetical protein
MKPIIVDTESVTAQHVDHSPELAKNIAENEMLLRLPVIMRTGVDEYEVIVGSEYYWAYIAAMNINSNLPDRINAILVEPEQRQAALAQFA